MQLEAGAVVQPVGCKALLLFAESDSQNSIGACAHVYPDEPRHLLLSAHTSQQVLPGVLYASGIAAIGCTAR